jgi:hypothetical protein
MWLNECPACGITAVNTPPNASDHSIIPITTSTDPNDFGTNDPQKLMGKVAFTEVIGGCYKDPGAEDDIMAFNGSSYTHIYINATSIYNSAGTDVFPCNSLTLGAACKTNPTDLCDAITHEVGHLFGLEHTYGNQADGAPNDCGSYSPGDVMYYTLDPKRLGKSNNCNGQLPTLTDNDKCMFRKLYCPDNYEPLNSGQGKSHILDMLCDLASVDRGNLSPTFDPLLSVYPNPSTGALTIQFSSKSEGTVMVGIFDILGREVKSTIYSEQPGRDTHMIDLSSLPSGHYIVRVQGINLRGSKIIEVMHK